MRASLRATPASSWLGAVTLAATAAAAQTRRTKRCLGLLSFRCVTWAVSSHSPPSLALQGREISACLIGCATCIPGPHATLGTSLCWPRDRCAFCPYVQRGLRARDLRRGVRQRHRLSLRLQVHRIHGGVMRADVQGNRVWSRPDMCRGHLRRCVVTIGLRQQRRLPRRLLLPQLLDLLGRPALRQRLPRRRRVRRGRVLPRWQLPHAVLG